MSLVSVFLGVSCIKPTLTMAVCKCITESDEFGFYRCYPDTENIPGSSFVCPVKYSGVGEECKQEECQIIQMPRNSKNNIVGTPPTCKCDNDPKSIDIYNYCDDQGTAAGIVGGGGAGFGTTSEPVCFASVWVPGTSYSCKCLTAIEEEKLKDGPWRKNVGDNAYWFDLRYYIESTAVGTLDSKHIFCDKFGPKTANPMISTGLGCIPVNFIQFVAWIFEKGSGVVGGIAFILLIGAFIQLATSEGDVKKIQGAKELITSTVTGLLLSIFSIFIIRLLMITILRIPGLK